MKKVGSTKLKNSLNSYLAEVKKGSRFVITDRNVPIAKLVPISELEQADEDSIVLSLIGKGLLEAKSLEGFEPKCALVKTKGAPAASIIIDDRKL